MASFQIDSYKLRLEIFRQGNPAITHRNRILEIASVPQYHGIVERALLNFSTLWDNWQSPERVGYYNASNPLQPWLSGWLPSADFALWYDVLRTEKPLILFYDIAPIGGASYVSKITLGSSTEPIGEGPRDLTP